MALSVIQSHVTLSPRSTNEWPCAECGKHHMLIFAPKSVGTKQRTSEMTSMAAMEQATLGQYFTTRKKGLEGVHPAKRRKVDVTETESDVAVRRSTRAKKQVASSQTNTSRARKGAKSRAKASLNEESSESSCKLGIKVVSETTSLFDDHAFAEALIGNLLDKQRKRKMASSMQTEDTIVNVSRDTSSVEICKAQGSSSGMESKPETRRRTAKSAKSSKQLVNNDKVVEQPQAAADQAQTVSSQSKAKFVSDQTPREADVPTESEAEAQTSPCKTPPVVRRVGGGVKVNPWIAEQAKIVLSRGRAAVTLSQQAKGKSKEGGQVTAGKDSSSGDV